MLDNVMKYPEVREFLSDYPRSKWQTCIDSVFLYGLHIIQRDFDSLTIPELIHLSGTQVKDYSIDTSYRTPSGTSRRGSKVSIVTDEETQTANAYEKKSHIYLNDPKNLIKKYGCQTVTNLQAQKQKTKDLFLFDNKHDKQNEIKISNAVKEPKICPIENAKTIMRNESYDKIKRNKNVKKKNLSLIYNESTSFNPEYLVDKFSGADKNRFPF
ncbi:hypothetical protein SteCoe_10297 [Stentor coeruleus]|uniref:Uncharacterized protein n=1 Tax=Stentor coeruleus TaxID=5963 RepID=A0A1R2CG19_9CILI|nr:hypothetical protein SteCoe_10297 [Stentor coeruleus]